MQNSSTATNWSLHLTHHAALTCVVSLVFLALNLLPFLIFLHRKIMALTPYVVQFAVKKPEMLHNAVGRFEVLSSAV